MLSFMDRPRADHQAAVVPLTKEQVVKKTYPFLSKAAGEMLQAAVAA